MTPRHQRELLAILSLLAGVFVGLTLLPFDVTGPLGRFVGGALWEYLGSGAALIPVLGLVAGLIGLRLLPRLELRRAAVLVGGLVFLVPFVIALLIGIKAGADLPASYQDWTLSQRAVGMIPALIVVGLRAAIGLGGAIIVWLAALSGIAVYSLDVSRLRSRRGKRREETGREGQSREERGGDSGGRYEAGEGGRGRERAAEGGRGRERAGAPQHSGRGPRPEDALDELPPLDLLRGRSVEAGVEEDDELDRLGAVLIDTLATFKVEGEIVGRTTGPVVTQFEVKPAPGVKVGKIAALADDLALAMRAKSIRIVAPIPGKAAVGVEVPNPTARIVPLMDLLESPEWQQAKAVLPVPLGKNLEGRPIVADLERMPHLLVAGATGSGKSVCINSIITGLVYRYTPQELRMLMIDPKMVELSMYNTLPHLRHPVVTDNKDAARVLKWAIHEMERRYELFHANGARNMHDFNRKVGEGKELVEVDREARSVQREGDTDEAGSLPASRFPLPYSDGPLPYIVLFVDELADLMMTVQGEVEKPLAILAQKARATGIHLILATQRPSVNVITGLIKANFPSRIAFRVASKVDSRTILDQNGAETLLGNGDMLFLPPGKSEPVRVQGAFIDTEETESLMAWYCERKATRDAELERQGKLVPEEAEENILSVVAALEAEEAAADRGEESLAGERDPLFKEAAEILVTNQMGSTSFLQRKLRIGYGRAARIIDQLHEAGILGPPDGSKAREILIGIEQLEEYCD